MDINHSFNSTNDYSSSVLNKMAKAKGNIKRNLNILKNSKANVHTLVAKTLKPFKVPLTEISN